MSSDYDTISLQEYKTVDNSVDRSELRASDTRRGSLQTYARLLSDTGVQVSLDADLNTATVDQSASPPQIRITSSEIKQTSTTYDPRVFDYLVQYGLAVHEVGHLLYTDHETLVTALSNVPPELREKARVFWNIFEDGAIEEALRRQFGERVTDLLAVTNANLRGGFPENTNRVRGDDIYAELAGGNIDFLKAIFMASLDFAVWDQGRVKQLLAPSDRDQSVLDSTTYDRLQNWIPALKDLAITVRTTPDPVARTDAIFEVWTKLEAELEVPKQSDTTDDSQMESELQVDWDRDGTGKPDDSRAQTGRGQPASVLADIDEKEIVEVIEGILEESSFGSTSSRSEAESQERNNESQLPSVDAEAVQQAHAQIELELAELEQGARIRDSDITAYRDIVQEAVDISGVLGGDASAEIVYIRGSQPTDQDTWQKAIDAGTPLVPVLLEKLRQERRTSIRRAQRRGQIDTRRLSKWVGFGERRVFKQHVQEEEKDHGCIIIFDRSGSMDGRQLRAAEEAVGGFIYALSEIGIPIELLDVLGGDVRIIGTSGQSPRSTAGAVFDGKASGGTPLTPALHLARKRVTQFSEHPFIIIVTDGLAHDIDSYHQELQACHFPVLGVLIEQHRFDEKFLDVQRTCYHQSLVVSPSESMPHSLLSLVQSTVF